MINEGNPARLAPLEPIFEEVDKGMNTLPGQKFSPLGTDPL